MAETLRPRVSISEVLQQLVTSGNNPLVVGIIGSSVSGSLTEFQSFSNISDVEAEYGANTNRGQILVELARNAFREGAATVKCISIGPAVLPQVATTLSASAAAGATTISVTSATGLSISDTIYIGTYAAGFKYEEKRVISGIAGTDISFTLPLQFAHASGEAVAEVTAYAKADYADAFDALEVDRDIQVVITDSDSNDVVDDLLVAVNAAAAKNNLMVAVRGFEYGTSASNAISAASADNDDRCIAVFPTVTDDVGKYLTGAHGAAMVAGAIAGRGVPGVNMNFLELDGASGVEAPIADFDALLNGGVSPIEIQNNVVRVTRTVTTSITIDSVASDLLEEASVRLNVDNLQRNIQRTLEAKFLTSGNTRDTRNAIFTEVRRILETYNTLGILETDETTGTPGFKDPIVTTDSTNRKQINVAIEIAPAMPLVFIQLNFRINL